MKIQQSCVNSTLVMLGIFFIYGPRWRSMSMLLFKAWKGNRLSFQNTNWTFLYFQVRAVTSQSILKRLCTKYCHCTKSVWNIPLLSRSHYFFFFKRETITAVSHLWSWLFPRAPGIYRKAVLLCWNVVEQVTHGLVMRQWKQWGSQSVSCRKSWLVNLKMVPEV